MEKHDFIEKLQEIADGIEKMAQSMDSEPVEKTASEQKQASEDFDFGELGSRHGKGNNPLLDFCLS